MLLRRKLSDAIASDDWTAEVPVLPWPMCRKSFVFFTALLRNFSIVAFHRTFLFVLSRDSLSLVCGPSVGLVF